MDVATAGETLAATDADTLAAGDVTSLDPVVPPEAPDDAGAGEDGATEFVADEAALAEVAGDADALGEKERSSVAPDDPLQPASAVARQSAATPMPRVLRTIAPFGDTERLARGGSHLRARLRPQAGCMMSPWMDSTSSSRLDRCDRWNLGR
jgi:hypothetical protein